MFIPYGTDTAIYHWPIATGILIAINIIAYPIQWSVPGIDRDESAMHFDVDGAAEDLEEDLEDGVDEEQAGRMLQEFFRQTGPGWVPYALSHGDGLHPIQWLTSFFMHAGIGHLLGNMIFLWAFGIIVEGKVGPVVFAALYIAIGVVQNIIEQLLFLGTPDGPSLGASSAIYGIMMVSMLFAPKDNLLCVTLFFYQLFFFAVPSLIFGLFYLLWDFGFALFAGFGMGTPLLHVMGAGVGLVAGAILLRTNLARTENADLFSMFLEAAGVDISKRQKKPTKRDLAREAERLEQASENRQQNIELAWKSFDAHFNAGNVDAAVGVYTNLHRREPTQSWDENRLLKIIRHYMAKNDWNAVVGFSNEYLGLFTSKANTIRINLAKVFVLHQESPKKAIRVLRDIDASTLEPGQLKSAQQLVAKANQMIRDGTLEFDDD